MLITNFQPECAVADPLERHSALATIVEAFEDDPACRSFWPDLGTFHRSFPRFVELFAGPTQAERTADGAGAALWLAPGVQVDPDPLMAHLEATLPRERKAELLAGLEVQAGLHPHEPHWYLPFIGVRRRREGRVSEPRFCPRG